MDYPLIKFFLLVKCIDKCGSIFYKTTLSMNTSQELNVGENTLMDLLVLHPFILTF